MSALKPCPFCGNVELDAKTHASKFDGIEVFQAFIECWHCGARGPQTAWYAGPPEKALLKLSEMHDAEGWNVRA